MDLSHPLNKLPSNQSPHLYDEPFLNILSRFHSHRLSSRTRTHSQAIRPLSLVFPIQSTPSRLKRSNALSTPFVSSPLQCNTGHSHHQMVLLRRKAPHRPRFRPRRNPRHDLQRQGKGKVYSLHHKTLMRTACHAFLAYSSLSFRRSFTYQTTHGFWLRRWGISRHL